MQIGERWRAGSVPPRSLANHPEIIEVCRREEELNMRLLPGKQLWWTLTWLESKPIADLEGIIRVEHLDDGRAYAYVPDRGSEFDDFDDLDDEEADDDLFPEPTPRT